MVFFNWFDLASRKQQTDEISRAIAGEQITIDWHEADKQDKLNSIAERKALAAQKRPELSNEEARQWFDHYEGEAINWLEQCIQWNEQYIIHARNNIVYHQHRQRR
ncbi:hypothetical protein [Spirosoma utsteinense]|uniref:hypothetical protein n=1 Tax=Spirosoma utsteinense TaxID=2585773 RepID=UPI00164810AB|nr:hypothetical protein [Spirosoma utsteinense]MBC3789189.1 adenine specific DNA methylase Mod [Spirosoma utsteinense]